jgi:hypothetical protein
MAKKSTAKRERLKTPTSMQYVKWTSQGRFKEVDDVGQSQNATTVKSGYGDQGDQRKKHGAVRLRLGSLVSRPATVCPCG